MQADASNDRDDCAICLRQLKYPYGKLDACNHLFCFECIENWMKQRSACPLCYKATSHIVKVDRSGSEAEVVVEKRTAQEFEAELFVRDEDDDVPEQVDDITVAYASCRECQRSDNEHLLLLCDGVVGEGASGVPVRCNVAYHSYCLPEKLDRVPEGDWFCPFCTKKPEFEPSVHDAPNEGVIDAQEAALSGMQEFSSCALKSPQYPGSLSDEAGSENSTKTTLTTESSVVSFDSTYTAPDEENYDAAYQEVNSDDDFAPLHNTSSEAGDTNEDESTDSMMETASIDELLDDPECESISILSHAAH